MMAVDLHDGELLLPPQFFSDEHNILSLNRHFNHKGSCFGSFGSGFGSEFSSSVESELGSTETESSEEDDDYIAELTRQMAHYMLQDNDIQEKSWGLAGSSPQSTLWPTLGSNHTSPIGPSREPSPPVTPMIENFEKMMINEDMPMFNHGERYSNTPLQPTSVPVTARNPNVEFHLNQAHIDDQIRAIQFYRLKQEQIMKQLEHKQQLKHYQHKGRTGGGFNSCQKARPLGVSAYPWPTLQQQQQQQQQSTQQQSGSGMRAVFLGGSGSRSGSCGTGVYLPRGFGNSTEPRKKSGCPTVLIPAKVVQALQLHFDKMGVPSRFNGGFPLQNDALVDERNSLYPPQRRHSRAATATTLNHREMGLPQEWTY